MKKSSRRRFLALAAGLSAISTAFPMLRHRKLVNGKQIAHHVFFWLKNPTSTEDRDNLIAGVKTLSAIETVREIHIGVVAETEKRPVVDASWHVSELIFFDDLQGQTTYQSHQVHLDFVKKYSPLWEKVIVYNAKEV